MRSFEAIPILAAGQTIFSWRFLYLVCAVCGAGLAMGALPSLGLKAIIVVGVAATIVAIEFARRDIVLDPAWVIAAELFLTAPLGVVVAEGDVGVSSLVILNLGLVPFVAAALIRTPAARSGLLHVAPLALLALVATASLAWSPEAPYGTEKLAIFFVNGLVPATAVTVLYAAKQEVNWRLVVAFGFAYSLALLLVGTGWSGESDRRTVFDINPINISGYLTAILAVVIFGPFQRVAKITMAPVMLIAAALTLSLGPLVSIGLGVLAGCAEALRLAARAGRRTVLGWAALVVVPGISLVVIVSGAIDPFILPLIDDPNVTSREDFLAASIPLIELSPLFGIGFGGFASTGLHLYPHNLPDEVMTELGIVGVALLLVWGVMALRGALGSPMLVAVVVTTGTLTLFTGSVASQEAFWLFSALAVAVFAANRTGPGPSTAIQRSRT